MALKKKTVDPKEQADSADAVEEMPLVGSGPIAALTTHSDLDDDTPRLVRIRAGERLKPAMPPCPPERRGMVERAPVDPRGTSERCLAGVVPRGQRETEYAPPTKPGGRLSIRRLSRRGLSSYAWLNDSDPTGVDPVTKRAPEPPPPPPSP